MIGNTTPPTATAVFTNSNIKRGDAVLTSLR